MGLAEMKPNKTIKPCETYKPANTPGWNIDCSMGLIKQRTCDSCKRNKNNTYFKNQKRVMTPATLKGRIAFIKKVRSKQDQYMDWENL